MRDSDRRATSWIFCLLILVSTAVNSQKLPVSNISQDIQDKFGFGAEVIKGYYIVTITPGDDPRTHLHFDSCRNLEEISPMARFQYPAGIAGFRYMLCTIRSEDIASRPDRARIIGPGVRPLTREDLRKLGLQNTPEAPCSNCVWTPATVFVPAIGPAGAPVNDGLLLAATINFFYDHYGKDNVSIESQDVEHGHLVVTISNLRNTILQRLGLWEWLQVNVMLGHRRDEHFFEMNAEGRYASGAGSTPPPSTAFAGMEPRYHEQLERYANRLSVQLHDYLNRRGK